MLFSYLYALFTWPLKLIYNWRITHYLKKKEQIPKSSNNIQ